MYRYVIRRLIAAVPTIIIISILVSLLIRLQPGSVLMANLEEGGSYTEEELDLMAYNLGITRTWPHQYQCWVVGDLLNWAVTPAVQDPNSAVPKDGSILTLGFLGEKPLLGECDGGGLIRADFGQSLDSRRDILEQIGKRARVSIQLALMAMVVAISVALPLGIIAAVKQDSWVDYVSRLFSVLGLSVPDFFTATVLLYILSVWVGWTPPFGYFSFWSDTWTNLQAYTIPALIVGYRLSAISARMTRSAMLEVLRQDYVRTARAKGLEERPVILKHSLRNALIPVVTIMGTQLSFLLGGIVLIEVVFSLPGLGSLLLNAVEVRDYPVVQGVVVLTSITFILMNLLVDLSYALIDPRIRYS